MLAGLVGLAWLRGGRELVLTGLGDGLSLLYRYALVLVVSFLAAGFAEVLIPHDWVRTTLGADSGLRGILLATAAGAVTPAGPFVSMPIAAVNSAVISLNGRPARSATVRARHHARSASPSRKVVSTPNASSAVKTCQVSPRRPQPSGS